MVAEPDPRVDGRGRRLVLVRHGRTAWNAEGRAQGHADVSLDDTGREQAEEMADVVAAYDPALLASSDLARARETAAFLEKATGLTAREDARLREYDTGARTGLTRAEFAEVLGPERGRLVGRAQPRRRGGWRDRRAGRRTHRARPSRTSWPAWARGETGVVVLHGAALRVAVAGVLGWPLAANDGLEAMDNCAWAVLREHGGSRLRLASYNSNAVGTPPG